jgi:hypothetical protein
MRFVLLNDDLLPHLFVPAPQITQLRRGFVDHHLAQLSKHRI